MSVSIAKGVSAARISNPHSVALTDFGGVGDGVTDNTKAITAAEASAAQEIVLPEGTYVSTYTHYSVLTKRYVGPGKLVFSGKTNARWRSMVFNNPVDIDPTATAYFHNNTFPNAYRASYMFVGVSAAGTPGNIYHDVHGLAQDIVYHDYVAGYNTDDTDHHIGRSGGFVKHTRMAHGGQGDLTAHNYALSCYSQRPDVQHFLANPAILIYNGSLSVSASAGYGCYLETAEINFIDNGFSCSAFGDVRNYFRDGTDTALKMIWVHDRCQSANQPIDVVYSVVGNIKRGLDFTPAVLTSDKAALTLKANDRIYLSSEAPLDEILGGGTRWYSEILNNTYLNYDSASARIQLVVGSVAAFSCSSSALFVQGIQVMTTRQTGWTAATGTPTRSTFATGSVTLPQLAEHVKALIDDLISHGLIGT